MSSLPIRVLLIEDNPGDARLLDEMLHQPGALKAELTHLGCLNDALKHLAISAANIILLDLGLPDAEGLRAVRKVHAAAPNVPLVVLTSLDDESLAIQALQDGAQDYLIKGQIESHALLRALRYAIERQRMQVETDQVRKVQLQLKDEFLSHVSHELRSPLTAIYQFGTILADGLAGGITSDQRECLEIILRNVGQLQSMIGDLLEVTRAQEGKLTIDLECASVSDAIAYTVKTLTETAKAKGVTLSFDLPHPPLPLAYADPTRIRQILIILLDNAVKFTGPGGVVSVRARLLADDTCFLLLEVADSGCGIGADMTERIFERLSQTADATQSGRKGLGLGLYICKELVTRQGGNIWVTSSPQGSVFSFTLPVFSLAQLISPLLHGEVWPGDSVALLTVEIRSPDGWLSKETRELWAHDTRGLLERCLMPDLDVLLPKMGSGGPGEFFQVVAFADERGVAVLTKRIREQFQRLKYCKESGLTFSTSYRMLDQASASAKLPNEDRADEMAGRIEALIESEALAGAVHHEQ
jgi:signal transduction histidine kinase